MALYTPSGWSPTAEQVQDISQAIVQEVFLDNPIENTNDILTGYSHDQQILLTEAYAVVGKAITSCVPSAVGGLTLTEKTASPKLMGGRVTYCITDENQNLAFLKQAKQVFSDYFERNPATSELNLIFSQLALAIYNSIVPKIWFSDTAAALIAGGGVFTAGSDVGLFNQIDGLWKKIIALGATYKYTITKNSAATYALQALASGEGLTIVTEVYKGASTILRSRPNAKIMVTNTIWVQLQLDLANKGLDNGGIIQHFVDGVQNLSVFGVPVVNVPDWDITINTYQNAATKWNLPHRAVMTTTSNVPAYTLSKTDLERLDYKYDNINNTNIVDFGYFLGTELLVNDLVYAAY